MEVDADIIKGLPLKKNATTKELLYLLISMGCLMWFGWLLKGWIGAYQSALSTDHAEVMAAITASDGRHATNLAALAEKILSTTDAQQSQIRDNARAIELLRKYSVLRRDLQNWTIKLDRTNRDIQHVNPAELPGLNVPEFPDAKDSGTSPPN